MSSPPNSDREAWPSIEAERRVVSACFDTAGPAFPSFKDVAELFANESDRVTPRMISSILFQAFKSGRARVEFPDTYEVVEELGNELTTRFDVGKAVVVDVAKRLPSDQTHSLLGKAMANYLANEGNVLFDNDAIIAIGSGRGVFETIEAMRALPSPPIKARNAHIQSLSGTMNVKHHDKLKAMLDADFNLSMFGLCFEKGVKSFKPIGQDIATKNNSVDAARTLSGLTWKARDSHKPALALLGVGILAEGHCFHDAVQTRPSEVEDILEKLESLVAIVDEVRRDAPPWYCPVADIGNRLVYIPPPRHLEKGTPQAPKLVQDLITRVNKQLVTASIDQIKAIDRILLVAGTPQKAWALRHFLRKGSGFEIKVLCTDSETARTILDLDHLEEPSSSDRA